MTLLTLLGLAHKPLTAALVYQWDRWLDGPATLTLGGRRFEISHAGPAHTPEDLRRAFSGWNSLPLNMAYADVSGKIGWQLVGQAPVRRSGAGAVPLPAWDQDTGWEAEPVRRHQGDRNAPGFDRQNMGGLGVSHDPCEHRTQTRTPVRRAHKIGQIQESAGQDPGRITGGGGKLILTQDPEESPVAPLQRWAVRTVQALVSGRRA